MRHLKLFLIVAALLASVNPLSAQSRNYDKGWKEVDSLCDRQYYTQAYNRAEELYKQALKEGDSRQCLVGAGYLSMTASRFMEGSADSTLARYLTLLPRLNAVDKAVDHILIASFYSSYMESSNYWRINRNRPNDETNLDYRLWNTARFNAEVESHLRAAFADVELLKSTKAETLGKLVEVEESGKDGDLTPTLFDVMVLKMGQIITTVGYTRLNDKDIDNIGCIYAIPEVFTNIKVSPADSAKSLSAFYFKMLQERERSHLALKSSDRVMIKLYLTRLGKIDRIVSVSNNILFFRQSLSDAITHYRKNNDESVTGLYYELAKLNNNDGRDVEAVALCDTAISLYPESPGAIDCYNLKQDILRKTIEMETLEGVPSGRYSLAVATVTNVDSLFFRIIKDNNETEYYRTDQEKFRKKLLSSPVLKQWSMRVGDRHDYIERKLYFSIPPIPQGEYIILASYNSSFDSLIDCMEYVVQDVAIVLSGESGGRGFIVDRKSGKPVSGVEISVKVGKSKGADKTLATVKTDKDGHFDFTKHRSAIEDYYGVYYQVNYNGVKIKNRVYQLFYAQPETSTERRLFFDRPVYKPGDTVRFSLFVYKINRFEGTAVKGLRDKFEVYDINSKLVDSMSFTTDEYGTCSGMYVLPADAMPGRWHVEYGIEYHYREFFNVEAYKQPKFTVTLSKPAEMRSFGSPAHVEGVAASYSAVPVNGATVTYKITRSARRPFWRWGWWNWWRYSETHFADGETTTDERGAFSIEFVPTPDSSSDLSLKPLYDYRVEVKVTDINGETHEAFLSVPVGYENSYIAFDLEKKSVDDQTVTLSRYNLDKNELDGKADVTVELLKYTGKPLLSAPIMSNILELEGMDEVEMLIPRQEFERMFPLYRYDDYMTDYENWPVQKTLFSGKVDVGPAKPFAFGFKGREAGVYKLTAVMVTPEGDTLRTVAYNIYEPESALQPVTNGLIVANVDNMTHYVGETARLRVGSRFENVSVYVIVHKTDVLYRKELHKVSRGYMEIEIPVTDSLRGGFHVGVAAMKENVFEYEEFDIDVPYREKELEVTLETFRDKLTPGDNERWTLRIKEKASGIPVSANLMMTMYDAALDNYGSLRYNLKLWTHDYWGYGFEQIMNERLYSLYEYHVATDRKSSPRLYRFNILSLRSGLYGFGGYGTARGEDGLVLMRNSGRKSAKRMGVVEMEEEVVYTAEPEEYDVVTVIEVGAPESGARLSADDIQRMPSVDGLGEDLETEKTAEKAQQEPVSVRQNLNTLAFFQPAMRSGNDGTVELSFTVPGLLTKWNIRGQAWTKDLKEGSLSASAITQKRLMAVPNVPRFLRHGDTCLFSVKVSNMDDKEQRVAVSLTMSGADGGVLPMVVGDTIRHITLAAGTSGEVSFTLAVPRAAIFVANYRVVARGQGCSDGEQAPIPLLPSRQLVTESMAFYTNGTGEKSYELKHLTQLKANDRNTTLEHHSLTVEMTPNPIWMAIQSLPYVERQKNPSNIYRANAVYTNSLSYAIVKNNSRIESIFKEWEKYGEVAFASELDRNSDLKQTVMEETPWLQDAVGEEQRHRTVARFFNRTLLERNIQKDLSLLLDAQRPDGGWSWIEGGRWSSLYTTQYILKTFGLLQQQGVQIDARTRSALNKALDYVDRETYKYYVKYVKDKGYDVVNLDYLYVRSYYPDNRLSKSQQEAYDFFYNNAKKNNKEYHSLFTQAMLSVVFNRHGDKQLAREMAVRIREKALYSDEMGMYWRDNTSGYSWNERPIETQAMLIRTFDEVLGDKESVCRMQQWLLKQKQTTNWNTDVSTVNAIQALMTGVDDSASSSPATMQPSKMTVIFGSHMLSTDTTQYQIHISQRLQRDEITPADGRLTIRKDDRKIAWGAMYWQYFEQVDKIPASSMGVTLKRTLYKVMSDGSLSRASVAEGLKVGDKVHVRIEIVADRNMEYLELKDPRCAAMEPVSTRSGWNWNGGLSYYLSVTNAAQTLYIDRLEKGRYVVEYDMYVNNAGSYVTAPTTIQCLYAPEFRALCPAEKLTVKKQ